MEAVLWDVSTGTRGGTNRERILQALDERPRNANQFSEDLDLDNKTIRHHLAVLVENKVLTDSGDEDGAIYLPPDLVRRLWEAVERILTEAE